MGMPMARRLMAAGHDVFAVDPDARARDRARGGGMRTSADIASVAESRVVLVLVATGAQLLDVAEARAAHGRADDETWVICSTVGPRLAASAAKVLDAAGACVVDAPVTGGVPGAEQGTLRFLTAGEPAVIAALGEVFVALGEPLLVGERVGDGQATKLVNQLCSSSHLVVAAEAVAFATHLGLDPVRVLGAISGGSGSSWFLDERGPRMADLGTEPQVLTRLAILAKDNALVEEAAEAAGAHVPMLKAARAQYRRAAALGLLDADDSQIVRTYPTRGNG